MMTASDMLHQTWAAVDAESISTAGYHHRRIPGVGARSARAGIHHPSNLRILIIEVETKLVQGLQFGEVTKGYTIEVIEEEGAISMIIIKEANVIYREMFTVFCVDILEHWVPHISASDAVNSLIRQLSRWRRFFQRTVPGLSREEYIGLYGELSFIEAGLQSEVASLPLINAWQAPFATNQDFLFGTVAVEIKTTTSNNMDKIRITNARQLDSTGLSHLLLRRYGFDFRQDSGQTLPSLVGVLKSLLAESSPEALEVFEERLLSSGFVEAVPSEYDLWGVTPRRFNTFKVEGDFPMVLESTLQPGVSEISYTLDLAVATPYQINEPDFWALVIASYG